MDRAIVVAGVASMVVQVAVDEFPIQYTSVHAPEWVEIGAGGAGVNIATTLRALGNEVRLCTVVGADTVGDLLRRQLSALDLYSPHVMTGPGSSQTTVLVARDGRRIVYPYLQRVDTVEYPDEVFVDALRGADLAILTNTDFVRRLVPIAARHGVPIAVDLNVISSLREARWQPWLEVAHIVFCSHEQLACSPVDWIRQLMWTYPQVTTAVVGCGEKGAVMGLRDGRLVRVAALLPLTVVNTSAAGDSLFAAFLHSYLRRLDPAAALTRACVFAGWRIGHRNPTGALLSEPELDELSARHLGVVSSGRWDSLPPASL
jgi:acarbose 7IV-phosphotransferase